MDFDAKLTGFKELAELLRDLGPNLGKNVLRSSVAAGAAVVRVQTKRNAQAMADTGTMARAVYQKQIREQSGPEKQVFYVGVRQGKKQQSVGKKGLNRDAFYARWVEFGHFTRGPGKGGFFARSDGSLFRDTNRGGKNSAILVAQVQAGHVRWVPAHPFLRPAFDTQKENAVEAIGEKIRERLEKLKAGK